MVWRLTISETTAGSKVVWIKFVAKEIEESMSRDRKKFRTGVKFLAWATIVWKLLEFTGIGKMRAKQVDGSRF